MLRNAALRGAYLCMLLALTPLAFMTHATATPHRICEEHQQIEHGEDAHGEEEHWKEEHASSGHGGEEDHPDSEGEHEACHDLMLVDGLETAEQPTCPTLALAPAGEDFDTSLYASDAERRALYRFAPKQSPPNA